MIKTKQELGSSYIASSSPGLKMQTSRINDDDPEPAAARQDAAENSMDAQMMAGPDAAAGAESSNMPAQKTS